MKKKTNFLSPTLVVPVVLFTLLTACGDKTSAPESSAASGSIGENPPVVLISIDTLRSDRLPVYGYAEVETPAIDALRRDGVLFERAYTHAPTTLPAHASLLTGRIQSFHGVRDNAGYRLEEDFKPYLPEVLSEAGYRTLGAVSTYVLRRDTGIARGFDAYDDGIDSNATASLWGAERHGDKTLEIALRSLDEVSSSAPPFLFFHIYEPHLPHSPPEPFASRYGMTYEGEIAAADAIIGDLLDGLRERGLYDQALIVLLSDHGEGFGEHQENGHGVFLYRESVQVPLLVKLPGAHRAGATVADPVQLVDVAPTVIDVLGLTPVSEFDGVSLLGAINGESIAERPLFSETLYPRLHFGWSDLASIVRGKYQYIEAPEPELYDLLADPAQQRNILRDERRVYSELRDLMKELRKPFEEPMQEDEETARQLAALGYLSSSGGDSDGPLPDPKAEMMRNAERLDRAFGLISAERYEEAIPLFRELLDENPLMTDAWGNLGAALRKTGRLEESLEAYKKALELSHGSPEGAIFVGRVLLDLRRFDEARAHAELARDWNPRLTHDLLGEIALASGDLQSALQWAKADPPAGHEMRRRLAMILAERGQVPQAQELLEALVVEFPDAAPALSSLAMIRISSGRLDEAAELLERALQADPNSPTAYENRGLLALQQGRFAAALADLEKTVELAPRASNAWNLLAVARFQSGDAGGAIAAWQAAVDADPQHFDALFNLAFTAADSGQTEIARRALRQYIDTAPAQRLGREIEQARRRLQLLGSS